MRYIYSEKIDELDGSLIVRIELVSDSGKNWVFTNDTNNRHYQEYLRYTAWVEAGNNPEDFWTRDLDSPEGLEQPKEEEETPQETEGES